MTKSKEELEKVIEAWGLPDAFADELRKVFSLREQELLKEKHEHGLDQYA